MQIKLVAMDLDDTLLNSRLELSPRSIAAVRRASECGIIMTFATNRGLRSTRPFIEPLGISGLVITYGGAQIREAESGQVVHEVVIAPDLAAEVLRFAAEHNVYAQLQRNDDIFYAEACEWSRKYETYVKYSGQVMSDLINQTQNTAHKVPAASRLMILAEPKTIARLLPLARERFSDRLWVTSSKPWFMEFNHPAATKGLALQALCEHLGLEPKNIAAFGDHPVVDLSMIQFAGLGVAMGNAPQSLKDAAARVAPTNDEDGVAAIIEEILANKQL